jgi:hypothetical protein
VRAGPSVKEYSSVHLLKHQRNETPRAHFRTGIGI